MSQLHSQKKSFWGQWGSKTSDWGAVALWLPLEPPPTLLTLIDYDYIYKTIQYNIWNVSVRITFKI